MSIETRKTYLHKNADGSFEGNTPKYFCSYLATQPTLTVAMLGQDKDKPSDLNLPAIIPSASMVLRRTQTTLGLLRDVVQESSAEYWYEQGKRAGAAQEWDEAVYAFENCLKRDSSHWRGQLQLAAVLTHQKRILEATTRLLQSRDRPLSDWLVYRSELTMHEWQSLHEFLLDCKHIAQNSFDLLICLVFVGYVVNLDNSHLYRCLETAEELYPAESKQSILFHRLIAEFCQLNKDYDKSREYCSSLIEMVPSDAYAYGFRGTSLLSLNKLQEAIDDFDHSIILDPNYAVTYHNRGLAKTRLHDFGAAFADYNRSLELDAESFNSYNNRAGLKRRKKDYSGAIQDYDTAITLNPVYIYAFLGRGRTRYEAGLFQDALQDYNKAIELDPRRLNSYSKRALVKEALGDKVGAAQDRLNSMPI